MWIKDTKVISVETLSGLLNQVSGKFVLAVNGVGNLMILDEELKYVGFIDFAEDSIDLFEEEDDE